MKIKSSHKPFLSLESVALSDIIMNLFIFFFTSFSLLYTFNPYQESKIKVSLPKGATNVQERDEGSIIVTVTAKNDIYIGNTLIPRESILNELKKYGKDAKKKSVVVKADRQASVDYFVKVLDAAKQAGIDKLGVSIELEGNK